jgi:hypothetical protein
MTPPWFRLGLLLIVLLLAINSCSPSNAPTATGVPTPAATAVTQKVALAEGVLFQMIFKSGERLAHHRCRQLSFRYHPPDFYHVEVKAAHDSLPVFRGMDFGCECETAR